MGKVSVLRFAPVILLWVSASALACSAPAGKDAGVQEEDAAPLSISWLLADGRSCDEAGAQTVRIRLGRPDGFSATVIFRCTSGLGTAVSAPSVPPGAYRVTVDGRSGPGTVIYRGEAHVELPAAGELDVTLLPMTLRFTGGGSP